MLILDAPTTVPSTERRRPGRRATVAPALLPLLRADARAALPPLVECAPEGLGTGEGVMLGILLGAAGWAIIGAGIWALASG